LASSRGSEAPRARARARRERVAIVTTSYPSAPGDAAGHFVETQANALAAEGHTVVVLSGGAPYVNGGREGTPLVVRVADGGATGWPGVLPRLAERPLRALGLLGWSARVAAELRRRGPFERVIAHWLVPCGFPIALAAAPSAHIEIVVHGSDARALSRAPRVARLILSALDRRRTELRCVSEELRTLIERLAPNGSNLRLTVAPTRVELGEVPDRLRARQLLGISDATRLIVIVGRLIPDKRVREALGAAALVPDADAVVIGDGPEHAELARAFPTVRFAGRLPRQRALTWIAAADAVLSASRREGAPTVVREARALGVPVVAADAGDLARWAERDPGLFVVR
jgi:glycosyltransferase involved in cell wall biosynthesis